MGLSLLASGLLWVMLGCSQRSASPVSETDAGEGTVSVVPTVAAQFSVVVGGAVTTETQHWDGLSTGISSADLGIVGLQEEVDIGALRAAGFDVFAMASNNPVLPTDLSIDSDPSSSQAARSPVSIVGVGVDCSSAFDPVLRDINGISVAIFSVSGGESNDVEGGCGAGLEDGSALLQRIQQTRRDGVEIVIAALHWNDDRWSHGPSDVQLAHRLLDGGVDVLVGYGHHVGPVEVYETTDGRLTIAAYGLGALTTHEADHYRFGLHLPQVGDARDGMLLGFSVVKKDYGGQHQQVQLAHVMVDPTWVSQGDHIAPVVSRSEVVALAQRLQNTEALDDRMQLKQRIELLLFRRDRVAKAAGMDFLVPLQPSAL